MEKIIVGVPEKEYPIYFENSFANLPKFMKEHRCDEKILIITDDNVDSHYGHQVVQLLIDEGFNAFKHVVPSGENSKSFEVAQQIYNVCIDRELTRKSTLIALGGGVIGDLTGFIAATYMRGINFIQCPTTILSQSDSSVGGKVGINFHKHKNIVGAFHQPIFVYMAVNTLSTLAKREISAGFSEVIKHGSIYDKDFLLFLMENSKEIFGLNLEYIYKTIRRNCEIKSEVVAIDEKEQGIRALLNFGHTFGHAIESLKNFELLHGECVAIGMVMALELTNLLGYISCYERDRIIQLLKEYGLPTTVSGLSANQIYDHMFYDKKTENDILRLVILENIGKAIIIKNPNQEYIKKAIDFAIE